MNNPIAFNLTANTTFAPLRATRLVGDVTLINTGTTINAWVSTDGGATHGILPPRSYVRMEGVDLSKLSVRAESTTAVVSVVGNSRG